MPKTYLKTLNSLLFVAQSTNFGELALADGEPFDAGDEGDAQEQILSHMQADAYLLALLKGMNDRQKIILMYQLLRDSGYNLNHEDCAKTLGITRERYMVLLREVKKRSAKILQIPAE